MVKILKILLRNYFLGMAMDNWTDQQIIWNGCDYLNRFKTDCETPIEFGIAVRMIVVQRQMSDISVISWGEQVAFYEMMMMSTLY
jgi:hypothetical protein